MTYISTAERLGRAEGMREGVLTSLALLLSARFGAEGGAFLPELRQIAEMETLQRVLVRLATATTLDEVRAAYRPRE